MFVVGGLAIEGVNMASTLSSPSALWAVINQLQLLMFLILTGAYIPTEVESYISDSDYITFNFNFISFDFIPKLSSAKEWMGFEQGDSNLINLGLDSGSAFNNISSLLGSIIIIICLHLVL